jgi:hypothetical protein
MRWRTYAAILTIAVTAPHAACTSEPTAMKAPSFLTAAVNGSVQAQYSGSGNFRILQAGAQGPRFTLHSLGAGTSAAQGLAFQGMSAPTPGESPIGKLDEVTYRAKYWYDEGNVRKIFTARSGTLRFNDATPRRVAGSFRLSADLLYVCTLEPGFPATRVNCKPAQQDGSVEITGSFEAGPLGGDSPGLIPSEW